MHDQRLILAPHIPKTAGTFVRVTLESCLAGAGQCLDLSYEPRRIRAAKHRRQFEELPAHHRRDIAMIHGHDVEQFTKHFATGEQRPNYVTVLRNPIKRAISHYNYQLKAHNKTPPTNLVDDFKDFSNLNATNYSCKWLVDKFWSWTTRQDTDLLINAASILTAFEAVLLDYDLIADLQKFVCEYVDEQFRVESEFINKEPWFDDIIRTDLSFIADQNIDDIALYLFASERAGYAIDRHGFPERALEQAEERVRTLKSELARNQLNRDPTRNLFDPHHAYSMLNYHLLQNGELEDRLNRDMKPDIDIDPNGYSHLKWANALQLLQRYEDAGDLLSDAAGDFPSNDIVRVYGALNYGTIGRHDEASTLLDGCSAYCKAAPLFRVIEALVTKQRGQQHEATEMLERAKKDIGYSEYFHTFGQYV